MRLEIIVYLYYKNSNIKIMERYTAQEEEGSIILWDNEREIGLKFQKGESLQRYNSQIVLKSWDLLKTGKALNVLEETSQALIEKAAELYPEEFREIQA